MSQRPNLAREGGIFPTKGSSEESILYRHSVFLPLSHLHVHLRRSITEPVLLSSNRIDYFAMKLLRTTAASFLGLFLTDVAAVSTDSPLPPPKVPDGGTVFQHFIAMNDTQTCVGDVHAMPFNNQIRGTNLGGWMVLEPWITPSMFYQFLGKGEGSAAFDTYTFCEVLGAKEANRQLRQHWATWVTEDIIKELAQSGAVNSLRLPIGDYMYKPYGIYSK